jgi:polar amino acid transport system substrate-binding protein
MKIKLHSNKLHHQVRLEVVMKHLKQLALLLFALCTLSPNFKLTGKKIPPAFVAESVSPIYMKTDGAVRVATMPISPFIIEQGSDLQGYSVDVWDQVARQLELKYEWQVYDDISQVLQAIKEQRADLAIAAISMTPDRDAYLDFTYPYFDSGLQIMVRRQSRPSFLQGISLVSLPFLLEVVLIGLLAGVLMAHLIWLVERRSNPDFPRGYFRGVWEGLWWLLSIIAAGVYRDQETKSVIKRLMTLVFWFAGIAIVAEFTATLTSTLTVHQLTSNIVGPSDLPGYRIATVDGTTAADYLRQRQLDFTNVEKIEQAYDLLLDSQIDAIVFDAPVLLYYASHQGNHKVTVPGKIFHLEKYGIALKTNDPLREDLNRVLLQLYQDGTLEDLQAKWFEGP